MRNEPSHFPTGEAEQLGEEKEEKEEEKQGRKDEDRSERGCKGEGCSHGGCTAMLYQCSVDQYLATGSTQVDQ